MDRSCRAGAELAQTPDIDVEVIRAHLGTKPPSTVLQVETAGERAGQLIAARGTLRECGTDALRVCVVEATYRVVRSAAVRDQTVDVDHVLTIVGAEQRQAPRFDVEKTATRIRGHPEACITETRPDGQMFSEPVVDAGGHADVVAARAVATHVTIGERTPARGVAAVQYAVEDGAQDRTRDRVQRVAGKATLSRLQVEPGQIHALHPRSQCGGTSHDAVVLHRGHVERGAGEQQRFSIGCPCEHPTRHNCERGHQQQRREMRRSVNDSAGKMERT